MDDQPEAADARLALDAGDDVVGQLDPLERAPEAELARVDHERLVVADHDLLGEARGRLAQVDRRGAVVVEHAERVAEAQVDARRLDQARIPGLDPDPAVARRARGSWRRTGRRPARSSPASLSAAAGSGSARAVRARARDVGRARARRRRRRRAPCGPRRGWRGNGLRGCRGWRRMPPSSSRGRRLVRLPLDRPPDDVDQPCEGDLQGEHQPDESPSHGRRSYPDRAAMSRRRQRRCRTTDFKAECVGTSCRPLIRLNRQRGRRVR